MKKRKQPPCKQAKPAAPDKRPLTDEEKQQGIQWLRDNGYTHIVMVTGKCELWNKKVGRYTIEVLSPISCWNVHVYNQGRELSWVFGECYSCEESVKRAIAYAGLELLRREVFPKAGIKEKKDGTK